MGRSYYYLGELWEIDAAITRTKTGAPIDLTGLKVRITKPDKTEEELTPEHTGIGADTVKRLFDQLGTWHATFENSEGELRGVETIEARVVPAPLRP